MAAYIELETRRLDGRVVIERKPISPDEPRARLYEILYDFFSPEAARIWALHYEIGRWGLLKNDFDEPVKVRVVKYHPVAQVREGVFFL